MMAANFTTSLNLTTEDSFANVSTWLRVLNGIVMALLLSFSVVGNFTVILLVIFNKKLQYRSIIVSLGLVVADLLASIAWNVQSLIATVLGEWPFQCEIAGSLYLTVLYTRWLELAVVSLDRFFIISFPFAYYKHSKVVLTVLTVLAWTIPSLVIIPGALAFDAYRFRIVVTTCTIDCLGGNDEVCFTYYAGVFAIFALIGGVLPIVLYTIMYCIGMKKRYEMRYRLGTQQQQQQQQHETTCNAETDVSSITSNTSVESEPNTSANSFGGKVKESMKWLRKHDKRALLTFFIVFVTLILTQVPLLVLSGLRDQEEIYSKIPLYVHFIAMYIFLSAPALDPLIVMRNRDFQKVIKRIVKKRPSMPTKNGAKLVKFRRNSSLHNTRLPQTINGLASHQQQQQNSLTGKQPSITVHRSVSDCSVSSLTQSGVDKETPE